MPKLPDEFREKLMQTIEDLREDIVRDTAQILKYETISGGKSDEEKEKFNKEINRCHEFLKNLVEPYGMTYREIDGVVSVLEMPGESEEKGLGIPLHIDVMPVTGDWKYPPFSGTVAEDIIWGRGAQDDKGPLIASIYGIIALKKLGAKFLRPIHIVMGRGEEVGHWGDVQYFIEKEGAPAFSFTPDAEFPIICGEKGIMYLKINGSWDEASSGESPVRFAAYKGGTRPNAVPDLAEIMVVPAGDQGAAENYLKKAVEEYKSQNSEAQISGPEFCGECDECPACFKITFKGESAHGSFPYEGHNAILDSLDFLARQDFPSKQIRDFCSFIHKSGSGFYGENLDIATEHHFVGKTTVNLGVLNMDEKGGQAVFNIRPTLGYTCKEIAERVSKIVNAESERTGTEISVNQTKEWGKEPLYVDPEENAFFIESLQEAYEKATGREPELTAIGGTTFAKAYPNCVSFGPVDEHEEKSLAHMTNEHVKVDHQMRNARIYGHAIALLTTDAIEK